MATTVRITETYDMKTTVGKMGLVGIHTPSVSLLRKLYPGLLKNHKFLRFVKADVVGACASVLPADPLQVGVTAGDVAPEDMFNPILYKAVTNSSFDTLVARIYNLTDVSSLNSVNAGQFSGGESYQFQVYYGLLAENGEYRKAMPQAGFKITNLVPLCHTLISTYGNVSPQGNKYALGDDGETPVAVPDIDSVNEMNQDWSSGTVSEAVTFRGKSVRMPKFPIHFDIEAMEDIPYPNVPETFVCALILPPAKLHEFYYRMRVTWTVRFENVCSTIEAGNFAAISGVGASARGTNYTFSSSKSDMETDMETVSADDVEITKVMES